MTEDLPPRPPPETSPAEKAEAAAIRRRWITLAEIVAIAGLLISAVSLWMSWADHRADQQEKQVERASETKARTVVILTATPERGGDRLALKDAAHPIQSIDLRFPTALGIAPQMTLVDPRIEANWLSRPILKLTDKGPDSAQGRVPVLVTANYWDADQQRADSAIYEVVWASEGRFLRGRVLKLKGAILRERGGSQARLDTLWQHAAPGAK
ncbi:hypothetical protein BH09PSE4_BH09PSE4_19710 [soil metagenome]